MSTSQRKKNPSRLPGTYGRRVFVGGSYATENRRFLDRLVAAIRKTGFVPVVADEYAMADEQIHDQSLLLLHSCQYAVLEMSTASGALMEVERTRDYGTKTLVLWRAEPTMEDWKVSKMLDSFVKSSGGLCQERSYERPEHAILLLRRWLECMKRHEANLDA